MILRLCMKKNDPQGLRIIYKFVNAANQKICAMQRLIKKTLFDALFIERVKKL